MDNSMIMRIALEQSAYDCSCAPEDFLSVHSNVHVPIQYNKDKSENPCKIKGFRDLSLFFFRLFFIKIRLCKVGRKGQCYINDKITATGNGGMNGKQKLDCLQRNHRCL